MTGSDIKPVLSVAGLDPSGGAGLIADMRVFELLGVYGVGILTAATAQSTCGVARIASLEGEIIEAQLDELLADMTPAATKTGMLYSADAARSVAARAATGSLGKLVVDPVLTSTSGDRLSDAALIDVLLVDLLPHCRLITPNLDEAEALTGIKIGTLEDAVVAARELAKAGPECVCITGGHLPGEPVDIFLGDGEVKYLGGARLHSGERIHGSGCFFSAAATAYLALGMNAEEAVARAGKLTRQAIGSSIKPGQGMAIPWIDASAFEPSGN